jgi:hypothetical protein
MRTARRWEGRWIENSSRRQGVLVMHRLLCSTLIGLAILSPAVLADDCDPRLPLRCKDKTPPVGGRCPTSTSNCTWVDLGTRRFHVATICGSSSPLCHTHSPGNCNAKVEIWAICHEYECQDSAGNSCGLQKQVHVSLEYLYTGEDCLGHNCPGLVPGTPAVRIFNP